MNENLTLSTPGLRLKAFLADLGVLSYRYGVIINTTYHNGIWVLPVLPKITYQAPLGRQMIHLGQVIERETGQVREGESPTVFPTIRSEVVEATTLEHSILRQREFGTMEEALAASTDTGGLWIAGNRFFLVPLASIEPLRQQRALVLRIESGIIQLDPVQAVCLRT